MIDSTVDSPTTTFESYTVEVGNFKHLCVAGQSGRFGRRLHGEQDAALRQGRQPGLQGHVRRARRVEIAGEMRDRG